MPAAALPPLRPDLGGGVTAATALPSLSSGRIWREGSCRCCKRRSTPPPSLGRGAASAAAIVAPAPPFTASKPPLSLPFLWPDLGEGRERGGAASVPSTSRHCHPPLLRRIWEGEGGEGHSEGREVRRCVVRPVTIFITKKLFAGGHPKVSPAKIDFLQK